MTEMLSDLITVLGSTMRLSTPLLLACLAGLFSERAGIFDIGLEGKMLSAAFFSAALAAITGSVWMGLAAGIAAALLLSVIHGLASVTFRGNQLISGVAINFLAAGMTVLVAHQVALMALNPAPPTPVAASCPTMILRTTSRFNERRLGRI